MSPPQSGHGGMLNCCLRLDHVTSTIRARWYVELFDQLSVNLCVSIRCNVDNLSCKVRVEVPDVVLKR